MGEEINIAQPPQLEVRILGTGPVRQVDIVKDGRFIYTARPQRKDVTVSYTDLESRPVRPATTMLASSRKTR